MSFRTLFRGSATWSDGSLPPCYCHYSCHPHLLKNLAGSHLSTFPQILLSPVCCCHRLCGQCIQPCCFLVPLPPQIRWRSPHFTSRDPYLGLFLGSCLYPNVSPRLQFKFPQPCIFSHLFIGCSNYIHYLISSPYLYFLLFLNFTSRVIPSAPLLSVPSNSMTYLPSFHSAPGKTPSVLFHEPISRLLRTGQHYCKFMSPLLAWALEPSKREKTAVDQNCRTFNECILCSFFTSVNRRGSWLELIPWQLKTMSC